jgi:hypothetical protein
VDPVDTDPDPQHWFGQYYIAEFNRSIHQKKCSFTSAKKVK